MTLARCGFWFYDGVHISADATQFSRTLTRHGAFSIGQQCLHELPLPL